MAQVPYRTLADLISTSLSPDELRQLLMSHGELAHLVDSLPPGASVAELATATVGLLQRHRLVGPFLEALLRERPRLEREIRPLMQGAGAPEPTARSRKPRPGRKVKPSRERGADPEEDLEPEEEEDGAEDADSPQEPRYTAARNDGLGEPDALELSDEINALAQLIMADSTQAPLAIGLFGDWGSGKSFFMQKLADRCDEIAEQHAISQDETFCDSVVQVRFNAWHYLDTQLWPPLVTTIFDELARKARGRESHEEYRRRLLANLESNKQLRQEAAQAVEDAQARVADVQLKLAAAEKRRQELPVDINKVVLRTVREWLESDKTSEKVREAIKKADEQIGLEGDLLDSTIEGSGAMIAEAQRTTGSAGALLREALRFRAELLTTRQALAALAVVAVLPLALDLALSWGLAELLGSIPADLGKNLSIILTAAAPVIAGVTAQLSGARERIDSARATLGRAQAAVDSLRSQQSAEEIELRVELEEQRAALEALQEKERLAEAEVDEAREALRAIDSGRMLLEFLSARADSDDYRSQQGIISMIREDFAELSTLLRRHGEQEARNKLLASPSGDEEAPSGEMPQIDRIILYIDDLDRCPPDRVVEVLQAVHLLLAFDLFVVVVGVDTRWLLRALAVRYPAFMGQDRPVTTPQNYLEKIFQLPLRLRPIDQAGFKSMVRALTPPPPPPPEPAGSEPAPAPAPAPAPEPEGGAAKKAAPELASPQALELERDEVELLTSFHQFIDTPRLVKRFVNIYRFLRVLMHLDAAAVPGRPQRSARMLLLAVLVGRHEVGTAILKAIRATPDRDDASLKELLGSLWPHWEVEVGGNIQLVKRESLDELGRIVQAPEGAVPKRAVAPGGVPLSAAGLRRRCGTLSALEALLDTEESLKGVTWAQWREASDAVFRFSAME